MADTEAELYDPSLDSQLSVRKLHDSPYASTRKKPKVFLETSALSNRADPGPTYIPPKACRYKGVTEEELADVLLN